ncbi:4-(cytidine 5'-diphospho)-2-C-methyl-D-erythritol kinase [Desulfovibrio inopinatus]|uniref:4-(cytidine 5'-diphospho)-2-C-methyl-D-erythritol kinase n=1 Tax=Desulfovibrio inopinatus TaxID=102109 RepID=UPI000423F321|nr:4-(cytidine 5'-diphospho)-2-C-methyl-D-erythritol kinase [Desulfovibrio inopinatus]
MHEAIRLKAGCKINLWLVIKGVLENGYHELETVFYPLSDPHDTLVVTPREGQGIVFTCSDSALDGQDNLVVRAYTTYAEATGFAPGIDVYLEKVVPTGAGLGGGSSDAAAMLRYLDQSARQSGEKGLALDALIDIAAGLGADVPVFLLGKPALATGIGEKLVSVAIDMTGMTLVLACPDVHVSTAWAYKAYDEHVASREAEKIDDEDLTSRLRRHTHMPFQNGVMLYNSFEEVVFSQYPEICRLKEILLTNGALGALMTGSGAAVFGLFHQAEAARNVKCSLDKSGIRTYLAHLG